MKYLVLLLLINSSLNANVFSAILEGDEEFIQSYIQSNGNMHIVNESNDTPIGMALKYGQTNVVKLMIPVFDDQVSIPIMKIGQDEFGVFRCRILDHGNITFVIKEREKKGITTIPKQIYQRYKIRLPEDFLKNYSKQYVPCQVGMYITENTEIKHVSIDFDNINLEDWSSEPSNIDLPYIGMLWGEYNLKEYFQNAYNDIRHDDQNVLVVVYRDNYRQFYNKKIDNNKKVLSILAMFLRHIDDIEELRKIVYTYVPSHKRRVEATEF